MEQIVRALKDLHSLYLVYDRNVEGWADALCGEVGFDGVLGIEAGEDSKTLDTVADICRTLLALGADRSSTLVAMGGGVTTDMAAFAASVYKRGINCILIPTTLLSMVDAAHGGKTGVNLDGYKNMIGTFAPPCYKTYIDTCFLETLPDREMLCGAAELIKTFIISDEARYEQAIRLFSGGRPEPESLRELIDAAIAVKLDIVGRDRLESGERRSLNLGHTIGHALEWYEHTHGAEHPLNHGEAVAIGIVYAAGLSERKGVAAPGLAARLARDLHACGLPTELPYPVEALQEAISKDKKNSGGEPRWVLIRDIADVIV